MLAFDYNENINKSPVSQLFSHSGEQPNKLY